ncbi:MAG: dihydrolipoyllysine-residue acetyltransferase [Chlorobi bacterium]|nr:dihydrolipoyllysine-residue acetyltransferase [Chlorobiota bacterium]
MATEFKLPELGENIDSAEVTKVLVAVGDTVEKDQIVLEIETDKATVEVPSEINGVVKEVRVKVGDTAKIGSVLFMIEETSKKRKRKKEVVKPVEEIVKETTEPEVKTSVQVSASSSDISEFKLPELGENIETADVTKVLVKPGDKIEKDQIVLEIETDKATVEVPSEFAGTVKEVFIKEGDKAKVGQTIFSYVGEATRETAKKDEPSKVEPPKSEGSIPVTESVERSVKHEKPILPRREEIIKKIAPAAPSVRRFAREIGIDIHKVNGSGPGGRISIEDVKTFAKNINESLSKSVTGAALGINAEPLPDFSKWGEVDIQPMSNVRKKTAEHLSYAWATVPHVTQFDKADITELEKLRKQFAPKADAAGGKLTVTAILLKVIAAALTKFPQFNASVDMGNKSIIYKKYINIGIAVDTEKGLLVPVIKDVDKKNILQLSVELSEISKKARDKKITVDDLQGGNFSISNLGGIGGTYFTPIVNSPEVAILGVSRGSYEPVYKDGEFVPRLLLPLSLSYDHRVIDGADAARFIRWVSEALENPFLLSLEG